MHGDVALAADVHYSSCQRGAHSWLAGQLRPGSTDVLQVVEVEDWWPEGIPKWQPDQRPSSGGRPNYSVRRPLVLAILAIAAGCRRTARRARAELEQRLRRHLKPTNKSWRVDETYVRVQGRWCYLYRAIDSAGATIDFLLSALRDTDAAKRLFRNALRGRSQAT